MPPRRSSPRVELSTVYRSGRNTPQTVAASAPQSLPAPTSTRAKRTPNAFIHFRSFIARREGGLASRLTQREISQRAGVEWRNLRPAGKRLFQQKAREQARAAALAPQIQIPTPPPVPVVEKKFGHYRVREETSLGMDRIPQFSQPELPVQFPISPPQSLSSFESYNPILPVAGPSTGVISAPNSLDIPEWDGGDLPSGEDDGFNNFEDFFNLSSLEE
ncbi:hypothetical protein C8R46DRAFT_1061651 [Mycena filopes]|nr:hypothetical protein C8R46DRAFT_1061651 [Mycena filopes]